MFNKTASTFDRLSIRSKTIFDQLLRSPMGAELLEINSAERVARQRALIARRATIPAACAKANAAAAKEQLKAEVHLAAAMAAIQPAREALMVAMQAGIAAGHAEAAQLYEVESELLRIADKRIYASIQHLRGLDDAARAQAKLEIWVKPSPSGNRAVPVYDTTVPLVEKVTSGIAAAMDRVVAMQYEALTHQEVTTQLQEIFLSLGPVLEQLELLAPTVFEDEVQAPRPWGVRHLAPTQEPAAEILLAR